jgi:hypothetical protein
MSKIPPIIQKGRAASKLPKMFYLRYPATNNPADKKPSIIAVTQESHGSSKSIDLSIS